MSFLIDTNVLSELARPRPAAPVVAWFKATPDELLNVSVLTLGEIRNGVEKLADVAKRAKLRLWLERDLSTWFGERVLPIDQGVADRWGRLLAEAGRPLATVDSLLAATALHRDLTMVTRNVEDFAFPGLMVIDPWTPGRVS